MTIAKPTPGPWVFETGLNYYGIQKKDAPIFGTVHCDGFHIAVLPSDIPEREANAELIVEAGNVYSETGLTPRQLQQQRDELLEACVAALAEIEATGKSEGVFFGADKEVDAKLRAAIANAKAGAS